MTPPKILLTLISSLIPLTSLLFPQPTLAQTATIPTQNQWLDIGMILDSDPTKTSWPTFYEGITPGDIVKHNNTYYLYYIGSDDYISQKNNIGPARRSVGVATSQNGINWTHYSGNPILTFTSSGNPEEGAVSIGVYVDTSGVFHAYYGANSAANPTTSSVNANTRYATSTNGLNFSDQGIALNYTNSSIWGYGDELHGVGALKLGNTYYAYYVPNGVGSTFNRKLAVAWGTNPTNLNSSAGVTLNNTTINGGTFSVVPLSTNSLAYFTTQSGTTQVHTVSTSNPAQATSLTRTYTLPHAGKVYYLDTTKNTWFMAYDTWISIGLRLAPNGSPDTTPPTTPSSLTATAQNAHQLTLNWQPASDSNTGIAFYEVYRNSVLLGTTKSLSYQDTGLAERTSYTYTIRARNYHNTQGQAAQIAFTTPADTIAPSVSSIHTNSNRNQIIVTFSEPVETSSAQNTANYRLSHNLSLTQAALQSDNQTVILSTSVIPNNLTATLEVTGVRDRAQVPNSMSQEHQFTSSSLTALKACYRLDQNSSQFDTSGSASHAQIKGSPTWATGRLGTAINLNGTDQYLHIPHTPALNTTFSNSFTFSGWVKPQDTPPYTTASNGAYTVFSGPNIRIHYNNLQRFMVRTSTGSGSVSLTTSSTFAPNVWYHLTMTVDNSTKQLRLYLYNQSGAQIASQSVGFTGSLNLLPPPQTDNWNINGSHFNIGVQDPYFDYEKNFFKGQLDDVRIYNRALTVTEVLSLTQLSDPLTPTPLASPTPTGIGGPTPTPNPYDSDQDGDLDFIDFATLLQYQDFANIFDFTRFLSLFGR